MDSNACPQCRSSFVHREVGRTPASSCPSCRGIWDRAWELYRRDFRQDRRWIFTRELWANLPFRILRTASPFLKPPSYQSVLFNFLVYGASGFLLLVAAAIFLVVFSTGRGFTPGAIPPFLFPATFLSSGTGGAVGIRVIDFFREPPDWESYLAAARSERSGGGRSP